MGKASVARQVKRSSAATDVSFAICRFVNESISDDAAIDASDRDPLQLRDVQNSSILQSLYQIYLPRKKAMTKETSQALAIKYHCQGLTVRRRQR